VHYNFDNPNGAYEPRGFFNLIEFSLLDKDGERSSPLLVLAPPFLGPGFRLGAR